MKRYEGAADGTFHHRRVRGRKSGQKGAADTSTVRELEGRSDHDVAPLASRDMRHRRAIAPESLLKQLDQERYIGTEILLFLICREKSPDARDGIMHINIEESDPLTIGLGHVGGVRVVRDPLNEIGNLV